MDIKRKNTVLLWTALFLLVLNLTTIGTIWIEKRMETKNTSKKRNDFRHHHKEILINELHLNDSQIEFYHNSRTVHWSKLKAIKKHINESKGIIHNEIFSANPDTQRIFSLIDSIGYYNSEIERNNYLHFLELKSQLDSNQMEKFHEIMDNMLLRERQKTERIREKREELEQKSTNQ